MIMCLRTIIKRWYIILICAFLCAGGVYYEKSRVSPFILQTGDMTYIRIVKFDQIPVETLQETSVEIKMDSLVRAWPNLSMLSKKMDDSINIDMKRLNPKWQETEQSRKFGWLSEHFRINWVGPGMYELIFQIKKDEAKDAEYIRENHEKLIEEYQAYFRESAGMVINDTNLTTVKEFELVEDSGMPTTQQIEKKYAIIGFILGALVGIVIIMVWDARKRITL